MVNQPAVSPRPVSPIAILLAAFVVVIQTGGTALWGYVAKRLSDEGRLSYALLSSIGIQFWGPAVLIALVCGLCTLLVSGRAEHPGLPRATAWIFPFVTVLAGFLVIDVYHDRRWWYLSPLVVGITLLIGVIARLLLADPAGFAHDVARTSLTVVSYVVAFIALAMIYINKLRSVYSATAVTLICILLLLQMTDGDAVPLTRRLVYAIVGGLIVGQVTWVINYWSATGWTGGAFLLAVFYLIAGLSGAQLRDRVDRLDLLEFGGVAVAALAIVTVAVRYQS